MTLTQNFNNAYEMKQCTVIETICPVCGQYVELYPETAEAEFHEARIGGRLGMCPGTKQQIHNQPKRQRTLLRLEKNIHGRF